MAVGGKHGAVLAGRYRLLEQLGEGGMSSVWKAEHVSTHAHVAVKIIDPEIARLDFNVARFLREAKTLATLESPHVVRVLDYGADTDTAYLVMELLEGETLGRRLDVQGRLSVGETNRILREVCIAMAMVHERGLIHRDLKPDNIFLCLHAGQVVTKVVDFGIAKSLRGDVGTSMQTRTGQTLGTPSYMSPEQCRGLKDIDRRTDLWSLGVIAYQCLLGTEPFQGDVLGDLVLRICVDPLPVPSEHSSVPLPSVFDAWFAKAVARDRAARFQSAAELAAAFTRLSTAVGLGAAAAPPVVGAPQVTEMSELARTSPDTQSNASVGLGVVARRKLGTPLKLGAAALVAGALGLGLWVFRRTAPLPPPVRAVQSLKSAPVSAAEPWAPRSQRPVPSGRRWHSSPEPAAAAAPSPEQGAATEAKPPRPPSSAAPRAPRLQAPDRDIRHSR